MIDLLHDARDIRDREPRDDRRSHARDAKTHARMAGRETSERQRDRKRRRPRPEQNCERGKHDGGDKAGRERRIAIGRQVGDGARPRRDRQPEKRPAIGRLKREGVADRLEQGPQARQERRTGTEAGRRPD